MTPPPQPPPQPPPTLWEEIVELGKQKEDKNTKSCPDCKGAGKIELFNSWEDPCNTCKGKGFVSMLSKGNSSGSQQILTKADEFLQKFALNVGYKGVLIDTVPHSQEVDDFALDYGFVGAEDQGLSVTKLITSPDLFNAIKRLPNTSIKDFVLTYGDAEVFMDTEFSCKCIIFHTSEINKNVRMPVLIWRVPVVEEE